MSYAGSALGHGTSLVPWDCTDGLIPFHPPVDIASVRQLAQSSPSWNQPGLALLAIHNQLTHTCRISHGPCETKHQISSKKKTAIVTYIVWVVAGYPGNVKDAPAPMDLK